MRVRSHFGSSWRGFVLLSPTNWTIHWTSSLLKRKA